MRCASGLRGRGGSRINTAFYRPIPPVTALDWAGTTSQSLDGTFSQPYFWGAACNSYAAKNLVGAVATEAGQLGADHRWIGLAEADEWLKDSGAADSG